MKVLITGAGGQLGQCLKHSAPEGMELCALTHQQCDIADKNQVLQAIKHGAPELVINAAAYTAVDQAEQEPEQAFLVNAQGARHVAQACLEVGAKLIHISSDYVFSGSHLTPIDERCPPNPCNRYGESKLAGELAVAELMAEQALIMRTSGLYSAYGHNFVNTMRQLLTSREQVQVVDDQISAPTSADALSQWLWQLAALPNFSTLFGVYHASAAGSCSWYEFACAIAARIDSVAKIIPISTAQYCQRASITAKRPSYSALDSSKLSRCLKINWPHWEQLLDAYITAPL